MRKVKVTLKKRSTGKKFYLFPSAESLYVWVCALERGEQLQVSDIEEIVLEPNGFIEAELRGFEYAYEDDQKFKRLDMVRLGKAEQPKNASGVLVTVHSGWVLGGLLPLKRYSDSDIEVEPIETSDSKIDLGKLFNDGVSDDDGSIDVNVDEDEEER